MTNFEYIKSYFEKILKDERSFASYGRDILDEDAWHNCTTLESKFPEWCTADKYEDDSEDDWDAGCWVCRFLWLREEYKGDFEL